MNSKSNLDTGEFPLFHLDHPVVPQISSRLDPRVDVEVERGARYMDLPEEKIGLFIDPRIEDDDFRLGLTDPDHALHYFRDTITLIMNEGGFSLPNVRITTGVQLAGLHHAGFSQLVLASLPSDFSGSWCMEFASDDPGVISAQVAQTIDTLRKKLISFGVNISRSSTLSLLPKMIKARISLDQFRLTEATLREIIEMHPELRRVFMTLNSQSKLLIMSSISASSPEYFV